jgi:hypothetical protein
LFTFDQLLPWASTYYVCLPGSEEIMENFANLMQRLLEIQSGGRQRSPELIAEDERLMEGLRTLAVKSEQTLKGGPDYT